MNKGCLTKISLICLLCLLIVSASCCINIGGWSLNARYERTVQLSAPLKSGSTLAAQTHNGGITIAGADVTDCNLTAKITAHALTDEDAQKVAEQTKVTLVPFGDRLTVKIEKPMIMTNRSVSVELNATVPNKTSLELNTHNGGVKITDIVGDIDAATHNGGVSATKVEGSIKLETHNGSVTCKDISGDAKLRTHNGGIKVNYSEAAKPVCNVSVVTHNGGVEFVSPPNFSATVDVSTHNGSIRTDLPITLTGEITKRKLTGKIGSDEGRLHLETHNGSISIK
ncbi:MAG: hypothetical protein A2173_06280 [Planctomycetes bacterium RBG_13_44_8b]|nr:MAG: hypothetical protein A2173_06280 [Planctomycetes bacterium RBG_13_44_8b]